MNGRSLTVPSTSEVISTLVSEQEVEVATVEHVRESALVALRRQGDVADDELPIGFEHGPFDPVRDLFSLVHISFISAESRQT